MWCGCSECDLCFFLEGVPLFVSLLEITMMIIFTWLLKSSFNWVQPWFQQIPPIMRHLRLCLWMPSSCLRMEYWLSVAIFVDEITNSESVAKHSKNHKFLEPNPVEWDLLEFAAIVCNWVELVYTIRFWVATACVEGFEIITTY